jgi:PleD family two-component response regulator
MKAEGPVGGDLLYHGATVAEAVPIGELLEAIDKLLPDFSMTETHSGEEIPSEVFDKTVFLNHMLGDTELARDLTALFLSHYHELLSALRQALQRKDGPSLLEAAQALKSQLGIFGAFRALEMVGQLEVLARKEDLSTVSNVLPKLEDEVGNLSKELAVIWGQTNSGKILIADDDPVSRKLLQATLAKWGHEPVVCADGRQAIRALSSLDAPQMAILDWMMPGLEGVQVCRDLRARKKGPYVYVILLTGKDRSDDIIEGLDAGADDYLIKPFDPQDLRARLRAGFRCINLKDDLINEADIDAPSEFLDRVPRLETRDSILVSVKRDILSSREAGELLAILLIQIGWTQEMKAHHTRAESLVMEKVAQRLSGAMELQDHAGLYEADKILLVMKRADKDGIIKATRTMKNALTSAPVTVGKESVSVSINIGGTVISGSRIVALGSAILATEAALGSARSRGQNNVVFTPVNRAVTNPTASEESKTERPSLIDLDLILAARSGHLGRVSNLVARGAKVNARDAQGNTAILEAAFFKYPEIVQFLLEKGADPRLRNNAGDSALTEALRAGNLEIVNLLLSRVTPADVMANSGSLYKALVEASSYGKPELVNAVKRYLAGAGLQPSSKSKSGSGSQERSTPK